ncbi:Na+/H+ antiporter NhaC family protein [Maribacter sp. 2-571]|uniref:Na+/H+ antiporter NhaC family protein n=1 Tax=Maribacter sp. 2-571 TaxID=3417569 RepID=UPI003D3396CD
METFGLWSLLPTLVVVLLALFTKRTFESLLGGSLVGFLILAPNKFYSGFIDTLLSVLQDATIAWIVLVCGLFGSLVHLLTVSGGTKAFSDYLLRYVRGRKSALLITWAMGLLIFIDDYLNALTVGTSMKKVTDKFKVPREMLAYIVDSTAAPICVLIPLSTWAIYVAGLLESEGVALAGEGTMAYLKAIPFILYGWIAAIMVPFVATGIVPPLGAMKKAEERAKTGMLVPADSEAIAMEVPEVKHKNPKMLHFVLPILVLIAATIFFEIDALKGIVFALLFTVVYFAIGKVSSLVDAMEGIFSGFKSMLYALAIVVMSFVLKEVNDSLGLTTYIVDAVSPILSKELLPVVAFVSLALVTFSTGSFWGVYAISLPIIVPLAQSMGVDIFLAIGAVISAGAFGSHACFYGDATVLSASATGCNNVAHAITQLPYTLLSGFLSALGYLLLGYLL